LKPLSFVFVLLRRGDMWLGNGLEIVGLLLSEGLEGGRDLLRRAVQSYFLSLNALTQISVLLVLREVFFGLVEMVQRFHRDFADSERADLAPSSASSHAKQNPSVT